MILSKSHEDGALSPQMTNFGASFKKARESKGISLDQIAMDTKISTRFLSAIESEELHLLPGGIFNRGFVRAYAERVGLDPDQMVADYDRLVGVRDTAEPSLPPAGLPSKANKRLYPIAVALLFLATALFYIATRESGHPAPTSIPAAPASPAVGESPAATPAPPPPQAEPAPAPATEPAPTPPPKPQALTVDLEAREATWIKVKADGSSVNPGEILQPGMTRKFTAQESIDISVGNAGGLTLKINDQAAKPLGKSGQVREVTIRPDNLKDFIS